MGDFWLKCDSCNRENVGVTFVNGMRFCAKCYQETFGDTNPFYENDLRNKIAELETKLAKSDEKYNATNRAYWELVEKQDNDFLQYEKLIGENQKLKQQLAEKEKLISGFANSLKENYDFVLKLEDKDNEIKQLKLDLGMFKSVNEFINSYGIEKAREVLLQTEKTKNQDKISFAVEQLEKVKKELEFNSNNNEWITARDDRLLNGICDFIDSQIEELKKEMK